MPKQVVRIKATGLPAIAVTGKVETVRDVRRLFAATDKHLRAVARMFPDAATAKVETITVRAE